MVDWRNSRRVNIVRLILSALLVGCAVRLVLLDHRTADYEIFLRPWWDAAASGGWSAVARGFTNYAPPYEYLLVLATKLLGDVHDLVGIKLVSFAFEGANALIAARIMATCGLSRASQVLAAAAVWLAPSVIYNGAAWGQADAIWTTFVLLGVLAAVRSSPLSGLAFGAAFAVKAQGIFAGPAALGLALRDRRGFVAFALGFPLAVAALWAAPMLMGRDPADVLAIYLNQGRTFHWLSANAANPWLWVPNEYYKVGVLTGLALSLGTGVAIVALARRASTPALVLAVLTLSCFAMPYVLPKMHDRYFYAGEVLLILMAAADGRWRHLAVLAQLSSIFAYFAFDGVTDRLLHPAVVINTYILARAVMLIHADLRQEASGAPAARSIA